MDYRTDSFSRRFRSAGPLLGARDIRGLVSLKHRDSSVGGSEYSHFMDGDLRRGLGLDVERVDGDFGGQAWLVTDKTRNKVILVEHETGLEILGAIGSIASLIALAPMISAGWTRLRRRLLGPHFDRPDGESIEVRRFDQNDTLVEQRAPSIEVYVLNLTLQDNLQPRQRVDQLETEVENMKTQHHENPKRKPGPKRRSRKKK